MRNQFSAKRIWIALAVAAFLAAMIASGAWPILIILLVVLPLVGAVWGIRTYNHLLPLRIDLDRSLSDIDVSLRQRTDQIAALVGAVDGYVGHETGLQTAATRLRASGGNVESPADVDQANASAHAVVSQVLAVAERYPDLRASVQFQTLMTSVQNIEGRLAASRVAYNERVKEHNTAVRLFPTMLISSYLGFEQRVFFSDGDDAYQASLSFASSPAG